MAPFWTREPLLTNKDVVLEKGSTPQEFTVSTKDPYLPFLRKEEMDTETSVTKGASVIIGRAPKSVKPDTACNGYVNLEIPDIDYFPRAALILGWDKDGHINLVNLSDNIEVYVGASDKRLVPNDANFEKFKLECNKKLPYERCEELGNHLEIYVHYNDKELCFRSAGTAGAFIMDINEKRTFNN